MTDAYRIPSWLRATAAAAGARSAWLCSALFLCVGWAVAGDYAAKDLHMQRKTARLTLDYVQGRNDDLLRYEDRMYGAAFEVPLLWAERLPGWQDRVDRYRLRHWLTHLLFLAGGLGCYGLAFRLYGRRRLALGAMGLFLLHPRLYAHSFFNSKDPPFLSLFMLALGLLHWTFRAGSVKAYLLCGAALGLLANVRIMGLLLVGAVLVLRAVDYVRADRAARRRVLHTSGAFVLASALTFYALLPYLWGDPFRRLAEIIAYSAAYPFDSVQLFRGQYISFLEPPPEYVPVWFAITTPALVLGCGVVGVAAVVRRIRHRPGALLDPTPLRFELLLLACFVGPVLAVALLRPTIYHDWRHLYFIYAPFCLLAAGGLDALAQAASAIWRPRGLGIGGGGGLIGLGLLASALAWLGALAQLHPYQQLYFNFLVDRATPYRLESQFEVAGAYEDGSSTQSGLQFLLQRYPEGPIRLYSGNRPVGMPAEARQRFQQTDPGQADFVIRHFPSRVRIGPRLPPYAPVLHRSEVYGASIFEVTALNLARVDAATAAPYRAHYRALRARAPTIRAPFDINVYLEADAVSWVQQPCAPAALKPKFVLSVTPVHAQDLPPDRRRFGFDNRNFYFFERGVRLDDACLAVAPLPAYPIRHLHVGQWFPGESPPLWTAYLPARPRPAERAVYRTAYRALTAQPPAYRAAGVAVHVAPSTLSLVQAPCAREDMRAVFTVRGEPFAAWQPGRPALDLGFRFDARGFRFDAVCLATLPLPAYALRQLRITQWSEAGRPLWQAEIPVPLARRTLRDYRLASRSLPGAGGPRAGFDAYVTPARLTLAKAPCAVADTQAKFVVHAEPIDPRVLAGRPFANLDFAFPAVGVRVDGACLASVPLPAYPLRRLTVGQWQADADRMVWQTELRLPLAPAGETTYRAHYRALAEAVPALREPFRVYVAADAVTFAKEPCTEADTAPKFLLHVLPAHRRGGFDNRDFHFAWQGAHFEGRCLARAPLPAYPIARLRVGQFRSGAELLWQAEIRGPRR